MGGKPRSGDWLEERWGPAWVERVRGGSGSLCLPPTPVSSPGGCSLAALGRDLRPVHTGGLAPAQEMPFVCKQVQFINNEMGTGIYLFMMAFKSPIRSYMHFSCQFAKNLLKVLLM